MNMYVISCVWSGAFVPLVLSVVIDLAPPFGSVPFPCSLLHLVPPAHFPNTLPSTRAPFSSTKAVALPYPTGLPGNLGAVSSTWNIRGVVFAHGHGASHSLQQCARLRPQHWRRHRSERHHSCKCSWSPRPQLH